MKMNQKSGYDNLMGIKRNDRKKLIFGLVIILLTAVFQPADHAVFAVTNGFNLDVTNLYPNMDMTYQEGYIPRIEEGKAKIVIPLLHTGTEFVENSELTASIDYGAVSDTPFVIKQYQKKVKSQICTFGEENKEVYLIEFDLDLKDGRINGVYPVTVKIQYNTYDITADGFSYTTKEQVFPVYVTIKDGKDPGPAPEEPQENVNIRLEGCTIEPGLIYPGDTFTIQTDIKNTGTAAGIKNMKISYENPEGVLIPENHTGTIYLDGLGAGETKGLTMEMTAVRDITNPRQKVTMTLTYEDQEGNVHNETENIYITVQPAPEKEPEEQLPDYLELDTSHTFPGMTSSYAEGYEPAVSQDKATIILPLLLEGDGLINKNEITASVSFTDSSNQAFVLKSYEKKFQLGQVTSKEGEKAALYLVKFSLDLKKDRVNGVYPVTVNLKYQIGSELKEQSISLYLVVRDGKDPEETPQEPPVEFTPKIIIEACTIDPAECHTGDVITFTLTLKNTSSTSSVRNLELNYSSDSGDLLPLNYNNSIFIDRISAGSSKKLTFQMKASGEISASSQKITLNMQGEDDKAVSVSAMENLYLSIKQTFGIQVDKPGIKAEVESGKTETVTVPVFNTGRTKLKNVMCTLNLPGVIPSGTVFIGDIEPGASGEASIEAIIANKKITDSTVSEDDKYGLAEGTVTVAYEDEDGNSYQKEVTVKTKINPPGNQEEEPEGISSQWWISIITGLVMLQLIISGILIYRKKRLL